jgi:hypothetical protein
MTRLRSSTTRDRDERRAAITPTALGQLMARISEEFAATLTRDAVGELARCCSS